MTSLKVRLTTTATIVALCCGAALTAQDAGNSASAEKTFRMNADEGN